jgi:hypothetical protein
MAADAGRVWWQQTFQEDPHWRDHLLFYEYFHGDNGAGLGASHQTGWTGLVGGLMRMLGATDTKELLKVGKRAVLKGLERGGRAKRVKA